MTQNDKIREKTAQCVYYNSSVTLRKSAYVTTTTA